MHIEQTLMKLNISFLIKDDEFLKEYNEIWRNVRNNIKKEYHSESVYNEKDVTCKTKPFNGRINTNFHNNKIPKEAFLFIYLSVILIDSVFRLGENYCPQVFLAECNYLLKKRRCQSILLMI